MAQATCRYCSAVTLPGLGVCIQHIDLPDLDKAHLRMSFCTRDDKCCADVGDHAPDCPVELELRSIYGF